jgi:glycerol-3-phosphate acyltransferase PlsX
MSSATPLQKVCLAVDCMGGDHGPSVTLPACQAFLASHPRAELILVGRADAISPAASWPRCRTVATTEVVEMDDPIEVALRRKKDSSMRVAVGQVKADASGFAAAQACVSAGNTGALMAMAKICLKTMAHIERPAIAGMWPTLRGESIVLDIGATIGADAIHLVDLAIMGAAMARIVLGIERPTVGLLNVGTEEIKGVEMVKEAGRILRETNLPHFAYHGFVEGDDIGKGTVDVVVTEGFTGNIALKTAEGTAKQIGEYLRAAMSRTWTAKIGYLLARQAFDALREKMDPRRVNGGVFLGLGGIVIKSHGGTDALGFASAIDIGYDMAHYELLRTIREMLEQTPALASA